MFILEKRRLAGDHSYSFSFTETEKRRVLVVKFCLELQRSCGINSLVAVPTTLRSV